MTIWFTSDTHFNDQNIINHCNRPYADPEEMEESLVSNWNSVVARGDIVYHLGDFAYTWGSPDKILIDKLLSRLNGSKRLILGNHDRKPVLQSSRWSKVSQYDYLKVSLGGPTKQKIMVCHYPMRSWRGMQRGSWMLHGHSHGNLPDVGGKILDVGVDLHLYTPISLEFVRDYMNAREVMEWESRS